MFYAGSLNRRNQQFNLNNRFKTRIQYLIPYHNKEELEFHYISQMQKSAPIYLLLICLFIEDIFKYLTTNAIILVKSIHNICFGYINTI